MPRLDHILERKVSRKEFLSMLGFGLVALLGFSSLMGILSGEKKPLTPSTSHDYGYGPYGGKPKALAK